MDLWILNQEKDALTKVSYIHYSYFYDKANDEQLHIITNDDYDFGFYKTKQRALEVLGEIQKLLIGDVLVSKNLNTPNDEYLKSVGINNAAAYHLFTNHGQQVEFLHRDCVIYKMPER